jgi:hypothetical protein
MNTWQTIEELKDDWNGNGAKAFTKDHIEFAKRFAEHLGEDFLIFPTARKSIQLEYEDENTYIEFEIYQNRHISCLYMDEKDFGGEKNDILPD